MGNVIEWKMLLLKLERESAISISTRLQDVCIHTFQMVKKNEMKLEKKVFQSYPSHAKWFEIVQNNSKLFKVSQNYISKLLEKLFAQRFENLRKKIRKKKMFKKSSFNRTLSAFSSSAAISSSILVTLRRGFTLCHSMYHGQVRRRRYFL